MTVVTNDPEPIHEAYDKGWHLQDGRALAWLLAWCRWCEANGKRCNVVVRGARQASILVDDREVLRVPLKDLEQAAGRVADEQNPRGLFP